MLTSMEWALEFVGRGWPVLPLYPVVSGKCSCPDRLYKVGPDPSKWKCSPGKHPFANLSHGVKDATLDPDRVRMWWGPTMWPNAGVAIALAGAKLLDIAPDGVDDLAEFIARGLPDTLTFRSGGGEGHQHFLYRLPDNAPRTRLCLPKHYDILSEGYCVAPPTVHESGGSYVWLEYDTSRAPAEPPQWALELLLDQINVRTPAATVSVPGEAILGSNGEPPLDIDRDVWDGDNAADRSSGLWAIAGELAEAGANEETIVEALRERDQTLGWHKFSDRKDAEKRYRETARRQLANAMPRIHLNGSVFVPSSTPASTPVVHNEPWPEPLEDVAFYGPLGEFVLEATRQSEADPAAILGLTMSAVSALIDPQTGSYASNAWHPVRIWTIVVGPTAKGRKGSAGKIAESVARWADPDWAKLHVVEGLSSGEGLVWQVRDAIQKWDLKKQDWLVEDPGVDDKRLLNVESEFANVLRVMERDGNTLSAILRRAWDLPSSGVLGSMTKTSRTVASGAHIVLAGHVTREELLKYVNETELVNGFANRFLWLAARRQQELPFGEEIDTRLVGNFASVVARAADWSRSGHRMGWAPETRDAWQAAYHELGRAWPGMHGAVAARSEPQVKRISQFFAALDCTNLIRPEHLAAAMALWAYVDRTCHWIFGDVIGDRHADDILLGLRTHGEMTRTEISQWIGKHVNAASITRALNLLQRAGLATFSQSQTGGRPVETWRTL